MRFQSSQSQWGGNHRRRHTHEVHASTKTEDCEENDPLQSFQIQASRWRNEGNTRLLSGTYTLVPSDSWLLARAVVWCDYTACAGWQPSVCPRGKWGHASSGGDGAPQRRLHEWCQRDSTRGCRWTLNGNAHQNWWRQSEADKDQRKM